MTHAGHLDEEPTMQTLPLDNLWAADPAVAGIKAANLARAAAAGLRVLPGFVITAAAGAAAAGPGLGLSGFSTRSPSPQPQRSPPRAAA
jgi:hypothetical protein